MNEIQKQIYSYLLEEINSGRIQLNERIPTENELGEKFHTNRLNAHHAIKSLEKCGILMGGFGRSKGKTVQRIPSIYQLGTLQQAASRRICVLNHCREGIRHLHWNDLIINPLERALKENAIELVYRNISGMDDIDSCRRLLEELVTDGVNAILLIWEGLDEGNYFSDPELLFRFHDNVFVFERGNCPWQNWPYSMVAIDVFGEGVMAGEFLVQRGYEKIYFCAPENVKKSNWLNERWRGLHYGVLRDTGGQVEVGKYEYNYGETNLELISALKNDGGSARIGLVACNDILAARIIDDCRDAGLTFPDDAGLVSFDNDPNFRNYDLTTVAPALERIGRRLADLIVDAANERNRGEKSCLRISSELVVRQTA